MGIRDRIKRRLPIIGSGGNRGRAESVPAPTPPSAASAAPAQPAEVPDPREGRSAKDFIDELVKGNQVVLFMKGSPASPKCGFSASAAGILGSYEQALTHFDVLSDPEIRQEIKDYSQWPTIPQVYVGGEFLGGSDILRQMHESGELKECIEQASAT